MSQPSPLWFASRGLGIVLLLTLTGTVVLGIVTSRRWSAEGWPRFVTSELHRNLSLLGVVLLVLHGASVLLDTYAHLGLRDVLIPFATAYRTLWLGLGVLAGELLVALVVVSLFRQRLGYGLWRLTHWAAYAAWPLALLHGLGTGSDTRFTWALLIYIGCAGAVLAAVLVRLSLHRPAPTASRVLAGGLVAAGALGVALWTMLGPLQSGWAAAAGTPPDLLGGAQSAAPASPSPSPSPSASPSASPSPSGASLPSGLNDPMRVSVSQTSGGEQVTFTDETDPTLQITLVVPGDGESGPLEVRDRGAVVCRTQASLARDVVATCAGTQVDIALLRQRGGLSAVLTTGGGP